MPWTAFKVAGRAHFANATDLQSALTNFVETRIRRPIRPPPRTISLSDDTRSRGSPREDVRFFVVAIWHHYRHGTWPYNSLPMGKSLGALCTDANIVSLSGPDLSVLKDVVALKDREILPLGIRNPREAPMSLKTALVSLLNVPAKQRQKKKTQTQQNRNETKNV